MAREKPVKPLAEADSSEEEDSSSTEIEKEDVQVQQQPQIKHSSEEEEDDEEQKQPDPVIQKSRKSSKSASKSKKEKRPRPLEDKQKSVSSKKPKKEDKNEKEEGMSLKKQATALFQRVFSDKDEIKILKGLIDYKVKKGVDPMLDLDEFHGFIKNSLECDCDKRQMVDKVKRLKKRFDNENKKLTTLHEHKIFELSKNIWEKVQSVDDDKDNVKNEVVVVNSRNTRAGEKWRSHGVSYLNWKGVECDGKERLREKGMKLMGDKARAELLEMWDKVDMAQMKVDGMRYEVLKEENRRIVEALKSGKP